MAGPFQIPRLFGSWPPRLPGFVRVELIERRQIRHRHPGSLSRLSQAANAIFLRAQSQYGLTRFQLQRKKVRLNCDWLGDSLRCKMVGTPLATGTAVEYR